MNHQTGLKLNNKSTTLLARVKNTSMSNQVPHRHFTVSVLTTCKVRSYCLLTLENSITKRIQTGPKNGTTSQSGKK